MGAMQSDDITSRERRYEQQRNQHPVAAPGASLQISAELDQPLSCRLKLSHCLIPLLRTPIEFTANSTCYVIGLVEMSACIERRLRHFCGVFIEQGFQLPDFPGSALLKAFD